jgi:hypothetical protein
MLQVDQAQNVASCPDGAQSQVSTNGLSILHEHERAIGVAAAGTVFVTATVRVTPGAGEP